LKVYPFLKLMEADGSVAVQILTHLVLGRPAALLNDKGI
jgi:hypothetical protein